MNVRNYSSNLYSALSLILVPTRYYPRRHYSRLHAWVGRSVASVC